MSTLSFNSPRHFPRSTSARTFPETYYNERHVSYDYSGGDPYAYSMGGPVSTLRNQSQDERDEIHPSQARARRRIAVACARCRKRKIRCSGDRGDGQGCQNCKAAGVESSQCQFHRVGSDHVHKVMDNFNMAQSLASMATAHDVNPLYSSAGNDPYHRSMHGQSYPQLDHKLVYSQIDAKPSYSADWVAAYGEDTSPLNKCSFNQPTTYLPRSTAPAGSTMYGASYRWQNSNSRHDQPRTSYYSDYGHSYITHGLPYLQTDVRTPIGPEPVSPLNMSSLQLTLPERPCQRQIQPTEVPVTPTRRHLPKPQPKPGHGLHHALDQQQGQRLRSSQTIATPSISNVASSYASNSFAKPLMPWTTADENLLIVANEPTTTMPPPSTLVAPALATDTSLQSPSTSAPGTDASKSSTTASTGELTFHTFPYLDPSSVASPTPPAYSNFRDSCNLSVSSTELQRNGFSSSLYTLDDASRSPSYPGGSSSANLVSGHRYTPLSQPTNTPTMENLTRESFEPRNIPLHRASTSNLNSSF